MTAGIRLLGFVLPLIFVGLAGALYSPAPMDDSDADDIALSTLPALPGWATASLPDFTTYGDTTEKKAAFFSFLYPRIVLANARILIQRQYLMALSQKEELTAEELRWLEQQSERLRVDAAPGSAEMFDMLARRLDAIPPSLILAQAANESAWGTSRFARSGNNLFGQWCFSEGCGLVPESRVQGASHEVASFQAPYQSIRSYIQNLNRHPAYHGLRTTREQLRQGGSNVTGHALAQGLISYSERGAEYVEEIRSMIRYNNLAYYDKQYRGKVGDGADPSTLMELSTTSEADLLTSRGTLAKAGKEG
ncbi:glucosaminidase domain-containing protein [Marinobacter changyiensis]|uniref:glucosaminidase domain-containing protein n=1 Tax=Marinobacter changyiensis TaxID=2604091 RepID=UPI0012650FC9|nr:glucosaminidase domain-containing protein [Marinobacter changyiensis]